MQQMQRTSKLYSSRFLGQRGEEYQANRTGRSATRLYQLEMYFKPYVSEMDTVLDLGSNDGLFLRHLHCLRRIGIEVNEAARLECISTPVSEGPEIELHQDMSAVESNCVDVVISNHCLEHTLDPFHMVTEVKRVLRPGHRLILVVPFDDRRNPIHRNWRPNDPDNHLYTWSPRNIGNLLTEAGFEVEESRFHQIAVTKRFFWVRNILGDGAFKIACRALAFYKRKGEVFVLARKPAGKLHAGT